MSDIEHALQFVEQQLDYDDMTNMFSDDRADWRRIEVLLKKLQRLESDQFQLAVDGTPSVSGRNRGRG